MKIALVTLAILGLAACGGIERMKANLTGVSEVCHDSTVYLQFVSGVTPKIKAGRYVEC
jgi:hypothetical protein